MSTIINYKDYIIEITESGSGYQYIIKKDKKIITESVQKFPFPSEAEVHAKLYINRLSANKDGWRVS